MNLRISKKGRARLRTANKLIWSRGFNWMKRNGYTSLRDLRIGAMAFEAGWKAAIKKRNAKTKGGKTNG